MDAPPLPSGPIVVKDEVREALGAGRPVVALESTIIAHGLPRPDNLEAARRFERLLESSGGTPATIAVLDGVPLVGLDDDQLVRVATEEVHKASVRDLPALVGLGLSGATTVAATASLAAIAGIRVFATGGIGGVHRAANETFDESADLSALATTPVTVVAAGVKSILDVPATLERLETLGVPVLGYRTSRFPAFWCTDSGHQLEWSVPDPEAVVAVMRAHDRLGYRGGILVANPVPPDKQLDPDLHERLLAEALAAADRQRIRGKEVTPFLLEYIVRASGGKSLTVNLDLVENNVRVAGDIARSWCATDV